MDSKACFAVSIFALASEHCSFVIFHHLLKHTRRRAYKVKFKRDDLLTIFIRTSDTHDMTILPQIQHVQYLQHYNWQTTFKSTNVGISGRTTPSTRDHKQATNSANPRVNKIMEVHRLRTTDTWHVGCCHMTQITWHDVATFFRYIRISWGTPRRRCEHASWRQVSSH